MNKRAFVVYYFSDKPEKNDGGIIGLFALKEDAVNCRKLYANYESVEDDVDWENDAVIFVEDLDEYVCIYLKEIS